MTATPESIYCEEHQSALIAFACVHTVASLKDGKARGFHWSRDEDAAINACCSECADEYDRQGGEWNETASKLAQIKVICEECACKAALLNGIDVKAS